MRTGGRRKEELATVGRAGGGKLLAADSKEEVRAAAGEVWALSEKALLSVFLEVLAHSQPTYSEGLLEFKNLALEVLKWQRLSTGLLDSASTVLRKFG